MKRVLVTMQEGGTRRSFFPAEVKAFLEEHFEVVWNETGKKMTKEDLKPLLPEFDAVMTGWGSEFYDAALLGENPRLKLIAHTGGTVGNLLDASVYNVGVRVLTENQIYAESVAEGTIAFLLAAQRSIPDYVRIVREGGWKDDYNPFGSWCSLMDAKVGLVGFGTITRYLIPLLHAFRCDIRLFSHHAPDEEYRNKYGITMMELDDLFAECDIVSIHSALNAENRALVGAEQLSKMKDGALLLNTSRGAVIEEAALLDEAKKGRIRIMLDVFHQEPLAPDSPLRTLPNVYCIPHMGGPTMDRRGFGTMELARQMVRFFDGETDLPLEISRDVSSRMTKM